MNNSGNSFLDQTEITTLKNQPAFNKQAKPINLANGAHIKLVDIGEVSDNSVVQATQLVLAPVPVKQNKNGQLASQQPQKATDAMDELLARMTAATVDHSEAQGNSRKPEFQKNQVQKAISMVGDTTAFNIDGPSQLMSPTGFSDASFLHRRFDSKTIVSGQVLIAAGASRISEKDEMDKSQEKPKQIDGFQAKVEPPLFGDMSAIMQQMEDDSVVHHGAFRKQLMQPSSHMNRPGMNAHNSEEDSSIQLDTDPKGVGGFANHEDINLQIDPNLPVSMNKSNNYRSGLQIIEEEKTPQSASIPSPGVAAVAGLALLNGAEDQNTGANKGDVNKAKKKFWPPPCCGKKDARIAKPDPDGPPQPEAAQRKNIPLENKRTRNNGLAEIPEEGPSAEDNSAQGLIRSSDLDQTDRNLISPMQAVSAVAVVPSAYSPIDAGEAAKAAGSMKDIQKHKPSSLFRSQSESMPENRGFSSMENTPVKKTLVQRSKTGNQKDGMMKSAEIEPNNRDQTKSIFDNKYVIIATYCLRVVGAVILTINLVLDTSYAFLSTFTSMGLLSFYSFLIAARYAIPIVLVVRNCMYKVNEPIDKDRNDLSFISVTNSAKQAKEEADFFKQGYFLYGALPFCYLVGTHRLLNFKNSSSDMGTGLLLDFFMGAIAFLVVQTLNHGFLSTDATDAGQIYEFSDMQSATIVFKGLLIAELLVEFGLYTVELYFFNKFRTRRAISRQSFTLSEKSKRQRFGAKYAMANAIWTGVTMLLVLIISAASDRQLCRSDQTMSNMNDLVCVDCAISNCAACTASGQELCDACNPGFYLTNEGTQCVDSTCQIDQCDSCESQGPRQCDKCAAGFFLSDVNHCQNEKCLDKYCLSCNTYGETICDRCLKDFKFNKATGYCESAPCHLVNCKTCEPESTQCDNCLTGYIMDPRQGKCIVDQSCDVTGCQTCQDPAVCDICDRGLWLNRVVNKCIDGTCHINNCKVCQSEGPPVCDECESGYALVDGLCKSTTCLPGFEYNFQKNECEDKVCKVDYCGVCSSQGIEVCDRCKDSYYLTDNRCIDATCTDPGCGLCNVEGPGICIICKPDFYFVDFSTCESKICPTGFTWSDQTNKCEDVICKISNCRDCASSGILGCDTCEAGYYFDALTNKCELDVCKVENCGRCQADRNVCETCQSGLSLSNNECLDGTCLDANCRTCWANGPVLCELCNHNYYLLDFECKNTICTQAGYEFSYSTFKCEEAACKVQDCEKCHNSGISKCDKCKEGFLYDSSSNVCQPDLSCTVKYCSDCSSDRAVCTACETDYQLDSNGICINPLCLASACTNCAISPALCEECANGFWHDQTNRRCLDATCSVENCDECSNLGPAVCDYCKKGHLLSANECRTTSCSPDQRFDLATGLCVDIVCKIDNCKDCVTSGLEKCDACQEGHLVSADKTKCEIDQKCDVLFCENCVTDRSVCQGCKDLFWLDRNANECIDGSCQISNCSWCSATGPAQCDECEPGFILFNNLCISTKCPDGFQFNSATAKCEDTICKITGCEVCTNSGIFGCDKCATDYIYESWAKRCVFDTTCRVQGCADCTNNFDECSACAPGLWYDATKNECVNGQCKVENCADCSIPGPTKCDKCAAGFSQKDETSCLACETDGCLECSDTKTCTKCEEGRTLDEGICLGCSKELCYDCDAVTGKCAKCKPGHYMEEDGETCSPCPAGCPECSGPGGCLQCDAIKHIRIQPQNGRCFCDQTKGWYPNAGSSYDCICTSEWLTSGGDCTSCAATFPGCSQCSKITTQDTEAFTGGIQVIHNQFSPKVDPGTYICDQCSVASTFFNFNAGFCMRCDRDVSGCKTCGSNGGCSECLPSYALQNTGGCYPCEWHSTGCAKCTVDQCLECHPNYIKAAGFCLPRIF